MFSTWGLILKQLSLSCLESSANLTNVSLFTMIPTLDTTLSTPLFSPGFRFYLASLVLTCNVLRNIYGIIWGFCLTGWFNSPGYEWIFTSVSFIVSLFLSRSGNPLWISSFSAGFFSANCILPIVILIIFIQSIQSNGVMWVLSVISDLYSTFAGIVPRIFASVLFLSWFLFVILCIQVDFSVSLSCGSIVIGDPVSIMNFFFILFIFTFVANVYFVDCVYFVYVEYTLLIRLIYGC